MTQNIDIEINLPSYQLYKIYIIPGPTYLFPENNSVVLFLKDFTEITKAQKFKTDFVANVSHELRTPLVSIKSSLETILGPASDDAKAQKKFMKIMSDQVIRMENLINDLLILSRIELEEHIKPNQIVDINDIVLNIKSNFELPLKKKKLNLKVNLMQPTLVYVTDAYYPQVNGVVRTLHETGEILKSQGHNIEFITPQQFLTVPMPKYNEIRLSLNVWPRVSNLINAIKPDAIHIATEGPLGFMARRHCIKNGLKFTTSFHTRFDKYMKLYMPIIPAKWSEKFLCNFHNKAERILVTTESMREELIALGVDNNKMVTWTRGGNHGAFKNPVKRDLPYKRPIWIYVGRVAVEKNIKAFLDLELEGTKVIIGKGPDLNNLKKKFTKSTNKKYLKEVKKHLKKNKIKKYKIVLEPAKRNTAPAILSTALI